MHLTHEKNIQLNHKAVFKCEESFKSQFKNSSCLLTISVGQEVHENEKFDLTIDLVNRSFKKCTILVDDSLQRHSLALNSMKNAEDYYLTSIKLGDLWIKGNSRIYTKLTIPYDIIRWDKWLNHSNYFEQQQKIIELYNTNKDYKNAIDSTINNFISRYFKRIAINDVFNQTREFNHCWNYVIEECTALCLWVEDKYNFEVYPSMRSSAMNRTHDIFIKQKYPHLLNPVAIKFKNRKQFKQQDFQLIECPVL